MSTNDDWRLSARCRGQDTERWFPIGRANSPARVVAESAAKAVCLACPVRTDCLAHALDFPEYDGVWGGLDEGERRVLLRARQVA